MRSNRRSFERFAVLVVIVAAHVLLLEIVFRNGKVHVRMAAADSRRGELFFFEDLPPVIDEPAQTAVPQSAAAARRPVPAREASTAITVPEETPPASIDWYGDAEDVAREGLARSQERKPRAFGEQPRSPYREPKKYKPGYEWQPQEKIAGFNGPLPYVRLGKHCMLMPPFFGCGLAFGHRPKPAGATLDEIRDPDRPRDSVPDPPRDPAPDLPE